MKYYKIINDLFSGFYDENINENQLFDIIDNKKILKNDFYVIEEEKWLYLINNQSENFVIRSNNKKELFLYKIPECDIEGSKVFFDFKIEKWIDKGTTKEKQDFWKQKMIETNNKIKELYELGLNGGSEEQQLKLKLQEYKNNYFNALHEEALEINSKKGE